MKEFENGGFPPVGVLIYTVSYTPKMGLPNCRVNVDKLKNILKRC